MTVPSMEKGYTLPIVAGVASVILGFLALTGFIVPALTSSTSMEVRADKQQTSLKETVTVAVVVTSQDPVNAYAGVIEFDEERLSVERIDYNTSIASLWAEEPWYARGEGTITFTGGSTIPGGFTGEGSLLTVTFSPRSLGEARVTLKNARVLKHDGAGTDATLPAPLDAIFTVADEAAIVPITPREEVAIAVTDETPLYDLTDDGVVNLRDLAVFMTKIGSGDLAADYNGDGKVNSADLSILLLQL